MQQVSKHLRGTLCLTETTLDCVQVETYFGVLFIYIISMALNAKYQVSIHLRGWKLLAREPWRQQEGAPTPPQHY
jgi:hypothetical protein